MKTVWLGIDDKNKESAVTDKSRRRRGRPRVYVDGNPNPNVSVAIYCDSSIRDALHVEAARCGETPSKLGAEALTAFLSARAKARDYLDRNK
jgi:hypothetical protein